MTAGLTDRQAEVLNFIKNSIAAGAPPTRGEIAQHFGISYTAAADHVQALARRGVITFLPGKSRNIILLDQNWPKFNDINLFDQFNRVVFLMRCNR